MTALSLRAIHKSYGPGIKVLDGIDLELVSGEFFTLLGPSGCGKTTLLRIVAGFHQQDSGEVVADGVNLDPLPAHKRDIGMVFQDYAIFPHLTVAQNVAFGLKARNLPAGEIAKRVAESLNTVRLADYGDRLPSALSGGQQQRVGLARAMTIRPKLLLMDEPLSNLDAKLRVELREDIREIQQRLGITTIYVTHDQEEALAVSDRICVMNAGRIEQLGTPYDIYNHPRRRFASAFIGTMNFLSAELTQTGALRLGGKEWHLPGKHAPGPVELAFRPETVRLRAGGAADGIALSGKILKTTYLGREAIHTVETPEGTVLVQVASPARSELDKATQDVELDLPIADVVLFRPDGSRVELAP